MSPLETTTAIDVMWPGWARDPRIATVVTLHDLIPLIFPEQYLGDTAVRAFIRSSRADPSCRRVLAVSVTAEDAVERLEVAPDRVHVIHAGMSEHFAGMYGSSGRRGRICPAI